MTHTWRFFRVYVAPLWRWYVVGVALVLVTNALSVRVPVELAHGLDALRAATPGAGADMAVATAAIRIAVIGVVVIVVRSISRIAFFTPGRLAEFSLREDLFSHLLRLQPDFYARCVTGDLLSRATTDVTYARAVAGFATLQLVNIVAALGFGVTQMALLSPLLTCVTIIPIALGFLSVRLGVGRMFALQRLAQRQIAELSDDLLGALGGVATIQAFDVERVFVDRLSARAAELRATNLSMAWLRALVFPVLTVASGVSVYLLLAVGGPRALATGDPSPGELAAFVALLAYLLVPIRLLGIIVPVFQRSEAGLERIHEVFDTSPDRPELAGTPAPQGEGGPTIEVRGLTYAYPDAPDRPVLRDVSVVLPPGSTVGVYGATGSGKTTLLRLLARLRNPPPNTVFIDGADVRTLDLDVWRSRLATVAQSPFLFSETIRENIGFGADEAAIEAAATAASLRTDLAQLPDGLDTLVGERGVSLSGGQRQRVALARGLLRTADVELLDDVLSAVDHATEQEIVRVLKRRRSRARTPPTRLVVSLRMSALEVCDEVLVLDRGSLVDRGPHRELVERPGPYRDAWLAQRGPPPSDGA